MVRGPDYHGVIRDGRIVLDNRDVFKESLDRLEGKRVVVTLCEYAETRSDAQNRWYHGVALPMLAEFCGCSTKYMDKVVKLHLLPLNAEGEELELASTSDLSIRAFSHFMEDIVQLAAEIHCTDAHGRPLTLPSDRSIPLEDH